MLKISNIESAKLRKGKVEVDNNSKNDIDGKSEINNSKVYGNKINGNEVRNDEVIKEKNYQKTFKLPKISKSKETGRSLNFFTLEAKLVFTKLR